MSHYEKVSKLPGGRCHPEVICPKPCVKAWNEHCVTHCGDSCAVVCPPPVVVHFPGPILSTCPQESFVGTSAPLMKDHFFRYGSSLEAQSSLGSDVSLGGRYSYPCYSSKYTTYRRGSCGPC